MSSSILVLIEYVESYFHHSLGFGGLLFFFEGSDADVNILVLNNCEHQLHFSYNGESE